MYVEEFWAVYLNRRSKILDKTRISIGGMTSTIADPRVIFGQALSLKASSIIVAHNHPSGSLKPSQADIDLTKKLVAAGKILDIQLVDHLIISGDNYCSFADSGLL
jgi:DNA repair protein RadC